MNVHKYTTISPHTSFPFVATPTGACVVRIYFIFLCIDNMPSSETKAMKRADKGLPPFSVPKTLCFPPARPKGCADPMYVHSKSLGGFLVYGCHCPLTSTTCCCDRLPPNTTNPLVPSSGRYPPTQRVGERKILQADAWPGTAGQGRRLWSRRHQRPRRAHCVRGGYFRGGKPWTDGSESFLTWLEDSNGRIYDHVSSHLIDLGDVCGADTSRVTAEQRFVGVSRDEMLAKFGLWCETHPAGAKMQSDINAEIEMGFTEPWPRGTRDSK